MSAADEMAVAATNCRRDSFRDIVPSMLTDWLCVFGSVSFIGIARKSERAMRFASRGSEQN